MRKGPSLYYATDKNVFDAINQSKVDSDTLQGMFRRRNIVCSKQTKREDLALFFSRLTHDLLDHKDLSQKLGIQARRERITSVELTGTIGNEHCIAQATEILGRSLASQGDLQSIHVDGNRTSLIIKYTVVDYKKSEFAQLQHKIGHIELIKQPSKLVIRSTKNDYMDDVRDELVRTIKQEAGSELGRSEISLFHLPDPAIRNQFFSELINGDANYHRKDVGEVYVYKPKPSKKAKADDSDEDAEDQSEDEPHIERIILRGAGISQTELLHDLTGEKSYHIAKIGWILAKDRGTGSHFEMEATFANPKDCTGFSYILKRVYDLEEKGKISKFGRPPERREIDLLAELIERKAKETIDSLTSGSQP